MSLVLNISAGIQQCNIYFNNISGATTYTSYYGTISGSLTTTVSGTISGQLITGLVGGLMFFRIAAFNGATLITQSSQVQSIIRPGRPTISSAIGGIKKATLTVSRAYGATQHFVKYKKSSAANFTTIQIE